MNESKAALMKSGKAPRRNLRFGQMREGARRRARKRTGEGGEGHSQGITGMIEGYGWKLETEGYSSVEGE